MIDAGLTSANTREFGKNEVLVRVKEFESDTVGLGERMRIALQNKMPDNNVRILQTESVGSGVGADLRGKSVYAVVIALLFMLGYIAMRFWSFAFATGAIVALIHDAFVMLAIFLFSCKTKPTMAPLFALQENTGIDFSNNVTDTRDFSILSYRNFQSHQLVLSI